MAQQNMKLKVLTLITKLSDRDTHTLASTELDTIARSLEAATLPIFISCILSVSTADKPLVRKRTLSLLSTLSTLHTNSLSPFLPKILSFLLRRLRDNDSSIRSQCVSTIQALSSSIRKLPFFTAFLKPLSEALFTEQEVGAQSGVGMCLAAAIDAAGTEGVVVVEAGRWRGVVGRVERLLRSNGFKAKAAGLMVMGSVIGVGGLKGYNGIGGLVKLLVGFLSSEDWAARKAAAEALARLAIAGRDDVAEFKSDCLKVFEKRRFDKVKAVREVMNQMIEGWRRLADVSEDESPPPRSVGSSRGNGVTVIFVSGVRFINA